MSVKEPEMSTNSSRDEINIYGGDNNWNEPEVAPSSDRGDSLDEILTEDLLPEGAEPEEQADVEPETAEVEEPTEGELDEAPEADGEPADEEETEPDAEAEDDDAEPDAKKNDSNPMVPRQRLNKEIQKRQQMEARIKELESQTSTPAKANSPETVAEALNLDDAQVDAMFASVLDGDEAKAQSTFKDILTQFGNQLVAQVSQRSETVAESTYDRRQEINALQSAAAEVVADYPEFDRNHAEVDEGLVEEVLVLRDSLISSGSNAAESLRRAAKLVALEHGITSRSAAPVEKSVAKVGKKPTDVKAQVAKAESSPRRLQGDSARNKEVKVDIMTLTDDQFGQLSKDALAKARGDFF